MNIIDPIFRAFVNGMMKRRKIVETDSVLSLREGNYNKLLLPGCICSDGKPAKLYLWPGSEKDLMISFNGGGAALTPEDCRHPTLASSFVLGRPTLYSPNAEEIYEYGFYRMEDNGIQSPLPSNPFASWSKAILPYVSADFHTGTADIPYTDAKGRQQIFHFHGYLNFCAATAEVKKRWPKPERILITGSSAGSFGASALAGKIVELYPDCENITVYCDSSYIPVEHWREIANNFWKCPKEIAAPVHTDDICGDWLEALGKQYGDRIKLLYGCSTRDFILAKFSGYEHTGRFETSEEWLQRMEDGFRARIERFEKAGVEIFYYVNAVSDKDSGSGTVHCISQDKKWHETTVDGVTPAQWVMDAVEGRCRHVGMELLRQ